MQNPKTSPSDVERQQFARWSQIFLLLLLVLTGAVGQTFADAKTTKRSKSDLYDQAKAASIEILVNGRLAGSGWVADTAGYGFTAAHVVGRAKQVDVIGSFGRAIAEVVALDKGHDLALLMLPKKRSKYAFLPTAKKAPTVSQEIYLYGAPMFRHGVMFPGRVGRKETTYEYLGQQRFYIETFHVIGSSPHTTSGGPWFNAAGEIVGLQSGMMQLNGSAVGIAFVTPGKAIAKLLASKKSAATPTLGGAFEEIWEQETAFIAKFPPRSEGLIARVLHKDGPLDNAKIKVNDLILAADGKALRYRDQLLRMVRSKQPGDTIELRYLRPGVLGSNIAKVKLATLESK